MHISTSHVGELEALSAAHRPSGSDAAQRRPAAGLIRRLRVLAALLLVPLTSSAAAANITFIKSIGTATSTTAATTQSITVPAAGVDAGAAIIVSATFTNSPAAALTGTVSATDTAANSYTVISDATNGTNVRTVVLAALNVNRLVSGNTIVVTTPSVNRRTIAAAEFWGVDTADQSANATGNDTAPASGPATTLSANELLIGAIGINGIAGDNLAAGAGYTQITRVSAGTAVPAATNLLAYQLVADADEYEATATTTTTRQWAANLATFAPDATCGDGNLDAGEDCDEGPDNGTSTSCCNANCRFRASGQTCRASTGGCDSAEVCTGSSGTCPADVLRPNGFVCRASAGECDIAETCDGVSNNCPADVLVAADTPCTDDGTSCTIDICNGSSPACQHPADTGSPCIKFIQTIGTTTSTTAATTTSVTVPAAGVSSGGSVIITMGLPSNALGAPGDVSATDSAGNVYTVDSDVTNPANSRIVVLSSHKVLPLASGNTITVTHPSTNRRNMVAAEYSGLAASPTVDQTSTNVGNENNATPATTGTTPTTTQADQLLIGAFGVSGPSSDNFTAGAGYTSAGRVSASATAPTVTNIQEYRVVNTIGAYSAGFTTTTTTVRPYAAAIVTYKADVDCGNGVVDPGEECDLGLSGNGAATSCCTRNCKFRSSAGVCRAQNGACDVAETCTGTSEICPADARRPDGFVCRPIPAGEAGACDPVAETCDGVSNLCPPDSFLPAGSDCAVNNDTNPCTADQCNGTQAACTHPAGNPGAVCRAAAASCDAVEVCTGTSTACPANAFLPAGTLCRQATDLCDVDDVCSGLSQSCGQDFVRPNGFLCRAATDLCDADDTCDGTSKACVDHIRPAGAECRQSTDECDVTDLCDGTSKVCDDAVAEAGTSCGSPAADACDADDACDGTGKACQALVKPSGELCRDAADVCDVAEFCDGSNTACPADALQNAGVTCREAAGPCDVAETCTGSSTACPADAVQPASYLCRPQNGDCDVADYCDGTEVACSDDVHVPDGTLCVGTNPNACLNACSAGVCADGAPVTEQACCGNGILDGGESCDDGNQISGDTCPSRPGDDCQFAASGSLVRAARKNPKHDSRACQLEFAVANAASSSDRFGLPNWIQTCTDQDPACDLDPTPGRCRIAVAACLNNQDTNVPACVLNGVGSVAFDAPKRTLPAEQLALAAAGVAKLTAGIQQLLDPANPAAWYTNTLPVLASQRNLCSGTVLIDVLAGTDTKTTKKKAFSLKVRSLDLNGQKKISTLRLMCQSPTP